MHWREIGADFLISQLEYLAIKSRALLRSPVVEGHDKTVFLDISLFVALRYRRIGYIAALSADKNFKKTLDKFEKLCYYILKLVIANSKERSSLL